MSDNVELVEFASPTTSFATMEDIKKLKEQITGQITEQITEQFTEQFRYINKKLSKYDDIIESQQMRNIGSSGRDESSPSNKSEDPIYIYNAEVEAMDTGTDNVAFSSASPQCGTSSGN